MLNYSIRRALKGAGVLASTAALSLIVGVPAHADPSADGAEQAPFKNPKGAFCVARLDANTSGSTKQQLQPTCYQTATEAIKFASGGAIADAPADGKGLGS
ncbi:hypothetical protein [Microbispora sp. H10670]|uniref:hypothetical protein n=1 Tax=Microbispora sp. H10670 TaxID=2729108 RepID=UPI001603D328|nr:hypothetical protein [Microbispora sp. H10670]